MCVARLQLVNGVPAAHVVPSDITRGDTGDVRGPLQHGVIDRNVLAQGERLCQTRRELSRAEGGQAGKQARGFGQVQTQRIQQHGCSPEKHSRIPIEIASFQKTSRSLGVRFFSEPGHGKRITGIAFDAFWKLDIPIAGLRPSRLNSQYYDFSLLRGTERWT